MATILGAGAVGLTLAARLAAAGERVCLLTRRAEAAARLVEEGLVAEDPATGERRRMAVDARVGLEAPGPGEPLLLCVRAPDVAALAPALAALDPALTVVSFQNGVDAEARLAPHVHRVVGGVWRQTCTRVSDAHVRFTGATRVVLGLHPEGGHPVVRALAARLRAAGLDVGVSERIAEDKWLKLCVNLMSAPNALVRREDHEQGAFVEIKLRLLREARDVLAAADITARSCDGRDRSLDDEIRHQAGALARGTSARRLPLYNQVWASLRHGAAPEAEDYHRLVIDLGRRHGVATPANERLLAALAAARRDGRGPESVGAAELLGS